MGIDPQVQNSIFLTDDDLIVFRESQSSCGGKVRGGIETGEEGRREKSMYSGEGVVIMVVAKGRRGKKRAWCRGHWKAMREMVSTFFGHTMLT